MEKRTIVEKGGKKTLIKLVAGKDWQHVKVEKEGSLPRVKEFDTRTEAARFYETMKAEYAG